MDLINIITDLVKFRTETGNTAEIMQCFEYCKILFAQTDAKVETFGKRALRRFCLSVTPTAKTLTFSALGIWTLFPHRIICLRRKFTTAECMAAERWI